MRDVGRQIKCVDGSWDLQAVIGTLNLRSHLPSLHPPTIPSPPRLLFLSLLGWGEEVAALSPFLAKRLKGSDQDVLKSEPEHELICRVCYEVTKLEKIKIVILSSVMEENNYAVV
ncbi:hypothetical protein TNCT_613071 [Trichonephila clavata]|uniref:Uncharacterized protein n=1 Tax=Trichonephila clavata TaxID=2740835 RepID=A0A8X6F529_TRICU|nr:hypothetical protein TNCT_613071 [Trichonephila clavata]